MKFILLYVVHVIKLIKKHFKHAHFNCENVNVVDEVKVKIQQSAPLQAWSGPEGSRKLGFPDFMTTALDGSKVVSVTHRPPLLPANTPGTHFC
jgi:hypothetical protein